MLFVKSITIYNNAIVVSEERRGYRRQEGEGRESVSSGRSETNPAGGE
jgi:hypothetical protein